MPGYNVKGILIDDEGMTPILLDDYIETEHLVQTENEWLDLLEAKYKLEGLSLGSRLKISVLWIDEAARMKQSGEPFLPGFEV